MACCRPSAKHCGEDGGKSSARRPSCLRQSKSCKLVFQLVLTLSYFFVELLVGYIGNSMALVADSFHMLSDVISLLIGLIAVRMARKRSSKNTFGWVRAEVLGALVNSVFLLALCFSIFIEAVKRLFEPEAVHQPYLVLYVGIVGLIINIIGMAIFSHHHTHDHAHTHDKAHPKISKGFTETTSEALLQSAAAPGVQVQSEDMPDDSDGSASESQKMVFDDPQDHVKVNLTTSPAKVSPDFLQSDDIRPSFSCYFCRNAGYHQVVIAAANTSEEPCPKCVDKVNERRANGSPAKNANANLPDKIDAEKAVTHTGDTQEPLIPNQALGRKQKKQKSDHMNIRGVFLHIMGDFLGSVIVCVTATVLIICDKFDICGEKACSVDYAGSESFVPCWTLYLDPCLSLVMVLIICASTIPLLKESAFILLQTVPTHLRLDKVQSGLLKKVPSVKGMHEFHVWQLAGNRIIASAHVHCQSVAEYDQMATDIKQYFHDLGIHSTTIQPEFIDTFEEAAASRRVTDRTSSGSSGSGSQVRTAETDVLTAGLHAPKPVTIVTKDDHQISNRSSNVGPGQSPPRKRAPPNQQTCLIMCGPEKSCSDQELCCPRDSQDKSRKSGGSFKSEPSPNDNNVEFNRTQSGPSGSKVSSDSNAQAQIQGVSAFDVEC